MISLLCYISLYYNISYIFQNLNLDQNDNNNKLVDFNELYFFLNITSYFMITLYIFSLSYSFYISKINNKYIIGLTLIYLKHLIDIISTPKMRLIEYELNRSIMWAFSTPLMLKMFTDINNISLNDLNIYYHIVPICLHVFSIPFKNSVYYIIITIILSIPMCIFLKSLYKQLHLPFSNVYLLTWISFMIINLLEILQLFNPIIIHALYNLTDTICKFICNVVIANYIEIENAQRENIDLQGVQFISYIIKKINEFENNNIKITSICKNLILFFKNKFQNKIPKINIKLKLELLKKILPLNLDQDYINTRSNLESISNKEFTFICVMFMDIVNYTEIAKKYNSDIIFKLLDEVYNHFDAIIKKYSYLQKIETIGDAYMVVGDIYRNEINHKIVVKEIIQLGLEFIKEIKNINTPDKIPLSIRIGINIGSVNIGILGNEVPRLCIVGNTVNIASRLQSTADTNTIHMSRHVYDHAQEIDFGVNIKYIEKPDIFLKNIGSVTTYTIKPEEY